MVIAIVPDTTCMAIITPVQTNKYTINLFLHMGQSQDQLCWINNAQLFKKLSV